PPLFPLLLLPPPTSPLFPYTTLFRSHHHPCYPCCTRCRALHTRSRCRQAVLERSNRLRRLPGSLSETTKPNRDKAGLDKPGRRKDRKSTRLNSSHVKISYAVFCLKKK